MNKEDKSIMKTITDIISGKYPVNYEERSIIDCIFFSLFSIVIFISIMIKFLVNGQITEWIDALTHINVISISIFVWLLFLLYKFLYGYFYIKRFNQSIVKWTHFSGILIEKKRIIRGRARSRFVEYQPIVELENGEIIKAPSYYNSMPSEKNVMFICIKKNTILSSIHHFPRN